MNTIHLQDYNIFVGDSWQPFNYFLSDKQYTKILVLVDENTRTHCLPILLKRTGSNLDNISDIIEIPSGEQHKTIETCHKIWTAMLEAGTDRKSLLINLGGGVIGDMGGFCASTFKRGIDFVQMPTTLLSQVDASIGGKLGIDFQGVKNCVGVFNNPKMVFIYPKFLNTLSPREIKSGFAEIIKHSLICDAAQWKNIRHHIPNNINGVGWESYLTPSLQIKKNIVERDPFEQNVRKALNFGHTIGHAVESYSFMTPKPLLHGEAIAVGMIAEAYLSMQISELPLHDLEEITHYIIDIYGKVQIPVAAYPALIKLMQQDKKNSNNQINFTLLKKTGTFAINQMATEAQIFDSLDYYCQLKA